MATFNVGETIICSLEVRNASNTLVDPSTSIKITLYGHTSTGVIDVNMTKDSTGKYHYDFDSTGKAVGNYWAIFTAVDSNRTTTENSNFLIA